MVSPIYDLNPTIGITKASFPSGVQNVPPDSRGSLGVPPEHIVAKDGSMPGPANPPSEWSSGPDNNVYLQGE